MMYGSQPGTYISHPVMTGPEFVYTTAVPQQQILVPKVEYSPPIFNPQMIPAAPPQTVHYKLPQLPPKGSALSRPCVVLSLLLLLTALGLGIAAAAGKHWLQFSGGTGWDVNGIALTSKGRAQISFYKIFLDDPPTIVSRSIDVMDYLNNVANAYGVSNSYTQQLRDSIRACRAFVIIGIVFSFLASVVCIATLIQCYNWKTYRMLRMVAAVLSLIAFASFLITFVIWLSVTQMMYSTDQNSSAAVRLKCTNCSFGWPTWLCMTSFILSLLAACFLCLAMEPKQNSWKTRAPKNSGYYQTNGPIMVPPPTPVVATQPMMTMIQQPMVAPQYTNFAEPYVLVNSTPLTLNSGTVPYYY